MFGFVNMCSKRGMYWGEWAHDLVGCMIIVSKPSHLRCWKVSTMSVVGTDVVY